MGGATEEPVRVIRGEPDGEFWDLTIRGRGLDDYDGKTVLVRIGWPDRPPERLGSGEAQIADGGFELVFPAVWETSLYKTKLVLVDLDGDRACDMSRDRLFGDSRAVQTEVLIVNNEPSWEPNEMHEVGGDPYCEWFNSEWPLE